MTLDENSTKIDLWAEIHRLRAELEGPDGFATWKEAACAERQKRIRAEAALNNLRYACDNYFTEVSSEY